MEQRVMDKESFVQKVLQDMQQAKKQGILQKKRNDSEYHNYVEERQRKIIKRQRRLH